MKVLGRLYSGVERYSQDLPVSRKYCGAVHLQLRGLSRTRFNRLQQTDKPLFRMGRIWGAKSRWVEGNEAVPKD